MKKFWNFIKNEDTSETELLFNGPISEDTWWGDEVTPALFRDELAKVSGNLTVWLNSPGGDVFAASQIYSMLKNHKGKVTVKIDGIAASGIFRDRTVKQKLCFRCIFVLDKVPEFLHLVFSSFSEF